MTSQDDVERLQNRVERLERRAERERERRREAERIAERSTRDLYGRQRELEELAATLEERVEARTEDLEDRLAQQRALQAVSQRALRRINVDELMEELCRHTAEVIDADYCDVFQLRPDRDDLILRAGVGWPEGSIDEITLSTKEGSQSGYTVQNWEPTVVEDQREDERFRWPRTFEEAEIRSGITVVVPGPEQPWGVFGVHAKEPRAFDEHDVGFIQSMSRVLSLAVQRQRAQSDLEREKERFASLVRGVQEYAIFSCDADGHVQTWNVGAEKIMGYEEDEILDQHIRTIYPEEDREAGLPELNLTRAVERGSFEDEGWRIRADGSRFWAHITITALYDEDGEVRGFSKVARDMTERMRRERRLEESRQRYRTLVENIPNGAVALVDEELSYQMVGGTTPKGVENDIEQIEGQPVAEALPSNLGDEIVPRYEEAFEGRSSSFEHEIGGRVYRLRVVPVRDETGEIFAAMGMSQDVTEAKERERQLAASNQRLEQFAYAASHDLKEPLRMVTSYLQLLEDRYGDRLDEDGRELVDHAVNGARRMRSMIESLLAYARVRTEGNPIQPVDADAVLEDVLTDLEVRIEETGAEVTVGDLPRVAADPDQLGQVFRNLVSNALDYSGDEPPRVHVGAERSDRMHRLWVRDEGVGIPPEETERIFEVFHRLGGQGQNGGTGIGLAIADQIVERHGGELWVDSAQGEGSTFHFTMPAADASDGPPELGRGDQAARGGPRPS